MISQSRDLRTGTPVWKEYSTPRLKVRDTLDVKSTDVLVIGAGISGAMMAQSLADQGLKVIIVDKRKPLSGSTSASTALLQYEIDEPLIRLIKKVGEEKAISAWRRSKLGLESLASKIQALNIDCGFERRRSLYLSGNTLNPAQLEQECLRRASIGLPGLMVSKRELRDQFGLRGEAGLMSWDNIACNPVQLAAGFLKAALDKGAVLYSPVEIDRLEEGARHHKVFTGDGTCITAKHVIFATGYEIPRYIKTTRHKVQSTWAISTKPLTSIPQDMPFVWEAADPYIYCRTTKDRRLIFGGEDEEFSDSEKRDALLPAKTKRLEQKLRQLIPGLDFKTEHAWTGSFGASTTGLPSIGVIPGFKNIYGVMAYGGNGITFSRIAAEIVSSAVLGYADPDAEIFAF